MTPERGRSSRGPPLGPPTTASRRRTAQQRPAAQVSQVRGGPRTDPSEPRPPRPNHHHQACPHCDDAVARTTAPPCTMEATGTVRRSVAGAPSPRLRPCCAACVFRSRVRGRHAGGRVPGVWADPSAEPGPGHRTTPKWGIKPPLKPPRVVLCPLLWGIKPPLWGDKTTPLGGYNHPLWGIKPPPLLKPPPSG